MKFTLSEKLCLSERHILCEATEQQKFEIVLDKVIDLLASDSYDTSYLLTAGLVSKNKELLAIDKNNADKSFKTKDKNKIINALNKYINTTKKLILTWQDYPELKTAIDNLQNSSNNYSNNDLKSKKAVSNAFYVFSSLVNELAENGNISLNSGLKKYEDTIKTISIVKNNLNNRKEELITSASKNYLEAYNTFINFLKTAPKELLVFKNDSKIDVQKSVKNIQQVLEPIQLLKAEVNNLLSGSDNIDTTDKNSKHRIDWASKYNNCKTKEDFELFWTEYFSSEWGRYAQYAKNLGTAFTQELKKWGFSAESNPFIMYLKENKRLLKISKDQYNVIHNAVANNVLSKNDIAKKGSFGDQNIIFMPDLLNKSVLDIQNYLEIQQKLTHAQLNYSEMSTFSADPGKYLIELFTGTTDINSKLLPVSEIEDKLNSRLKSDKIKTSINNDELNKILSSITGVAEAKKYLAVLISMFSIENSADIDIVSSKMSPSLYNLIADAQVDLAKDTLLCKKLFKLEEKNISSKQVRYILTNLATKAGALERS